MGTTTSPPTLLAAVTARVHFPAPIAGRARQGVESLGVEHEPAHDSILGVPPDGLAVLGGVERAVLLGELHDQTL